MISVIVDEEHGIAILEPEGPISRNDFETVAKIIDPYIEKTERLNGLIIHTKSFPGWDSFAAAMCHLKFVREHHKQILRVALVTDSMVGGFAESVARHFVSAEVKLFSYHELEQAKLWVAEDTVNRPT